MCDCGWVLSPCQCVCTWHGVGVTVRGRWGVWGHLSVLVRLSRSVSLLEWTQCLPVSRVCVCVALGVGVCVYLVVATAAQSWTALEFLPDLSLGASVQCGW